MSACRYEKGPCTYPTLRRYFRCQDGSCPEQVGRMCSRPAGPADETKPPIRETPETTHETKPAAPPPAREEEKTMPNPAPSPTGTCPKCTRPDVKLMTNKFDAENPRTCPRCYNTAWAADKAKRTGAANVKRAATKAAKKVVAAKAAPGPSATKSPARVAKAPGAPKGPRLGLPIKDWPAAERAAAGRIAPGAIIPVPPTPGGLRLVFEVRIRPGMTPLEVMDLMRAVPSDAVVAG